MGASDVRGRLADADARWADGCELPHIVERSTTTWRRGVHARPRAAEGRSAATGFAHHGAPGPRGVVSHRQRLSRSENRSESAVPLSSLRQ